MNTRLLTALVFATLTLGPTVETRQATAQGGYPQGNQYSSARSVSSQAGYASGTAPANTSDPYDPRVWLQRTPRQGAAPANYQAGRNQQGRVQQVAQTEEVLPRSIVREAPVGSSRIISSGPVNSVGPAMGPGMSMGPPNGPTFSPYAGPMGGSDMMYEGGEVYEGGAPGGCTSCNGGGGGHAHGGSWDGFEGEGCNSCGEAMQNCDGGGCNNCGQCVQCCYPCPRFAHIQVFGGVQGFKNPSGFTSPSDTSPSSNGDFGFREGLMLTGAMPCWPWGALGYEVGAAVGQSQLAGSLETGDSRNQFFLTAGLFHHEQVGLQYGAVYDYLHDDYAGIVDSADLHQIRAQISLVNGRGHEIGFMGAFGLAPSNDSVFETVDQYLVYYRAVVTQINGEGRVFGGISDNSDGIIGLDWSVPITNYISTNFNSVYLIPSGDNLPASVGESWNIGFNIVAHLDGKARCQQSSVYRPMFGVADNGTMIQTFSGN